MSKLISYLYQNFLRKLLFLFPADEVHIYFVKLGNFCGRYLFTKKLFDFLFCYKNNKLTQSIFGIDFDNPVGLSAGFDKNGDLINILGNIGFSFAEIGTVTLKPYAGNPKPWNYRLPMSKALVVNYGLKNEGINKITEKIKISKPDNLKLCISIGKTNAEYTASDDCGIDDYFECLNYANSHNIGDFYSINISCPNTFGGEPFITSEKLDTLLNKINTLSLTKPIFLKMPINLAWEEFEKLCDTALRHNISGLIIGNLNKNRADPHIKEVIPDNIQGSVSGKPTQELSNKLIFKTYQKYQNRLIIIGVGGIFDATDAYEKIKRGASLVGMVTGMIYQGPQVIGDINRGLVRLLEKDSFDNISQAVGAYHKR